MLSLTRKTGYGLIALSHLAQAEGDRLISSREIAKAYDLSTSLLMNVLKDLSAAGYVESERGVHGGFRLAMDPDKVSLADLVTVLERPVKLAECVTEDVGEEECTCEVMAQCPIMDPVHRVHRRLNDLLKRITLAEILDPSLAGKINRA